MEVTLNLSSLIAAMGVFSVLPVMILLWTAPWGDIRANRCLCSLLFFTSLLALSHIAQKELDVSVFLRFALYPVQMLVGPALYFYIRTLTQPNFSWRATHLWHLIPMGVVAVLWPLQLKYELFEFLNLSCPDLQECSQIYTDRFIHRSLTWISLGVYSLVTLRILKQHRLNVRDHFSELGLVSLSWLKWVTLALLVLVITTIATEILYAQGSFSYKTFGGYQVASFPLLIYLIMGVFGLRQVKVFSSQDSVTVQNTPSSVDTGKYQTSTLTPELAEQLWLHLETYMHKEKPHLTHGLKISELAKQLNVQVNHLSETINGHSAQSFYDYINRYRVEEAADLLLAEKHQHLSINDISYRAGFNSNSTFFSHFKKRFELTPRQFRNREI